VTGRAPPGHTERHRLRANSHRAGDGRACAMSPLLCFQFGVADGPNRFLVCGESVVSAALHVHYTRVVGGRG